MRQSCQFQRSDGRAGRVTQQSSILDRRVEPRWDIAERPDQVLQEQIKRELKIPTVMAKILINRGIRDLPTGRDFLYPSLDHLIDPFLMADMHRAVARIWQALDSNEAIMVHGDYDVDGVTGTALIVNTLKALGADVSFYIPHRLEEGYGISKGAIDICVKQGRTLLVSVDCGITAIEETRYANEQGVDVIITDHHQSGELPEAVAVINPKRPDCRIDSVIGFPRLVVSSPFPGRIGDSAVILIGNRQA